MKHSETIVDAVQQSTDAIAGNLRSLRENRALSLDQLAELTGVSKSMLRQIETGKSNPTIATIWKIANGLHISFTALLNKPDIQVQVKSFQSGTPLTAAGKHYRLYPLIPFSPQQAFETYYVEIDPATVYRGEPHKGHVYEHIFVTRGQLQMTVDGKAYEINAGEFLEFPANCPHQYKCLGDDMATAIMQISYLL